MKIVSSTAFPSGSRAHGSHAADVAFDLAATGNEVHAVTSRHGYEGGDRRYAAEETVKRRAHSSRDDGLWARLARWAGAITSVLPFSFCSLVRVLKEGDIVVANRSATASGRCRAGSAAAARGW
jgi:hypothetical protein